MRNIALNTYPWWKYLWIAVVILLGVVYAVPNLYGEDPAVQISFVNEEKPSPASITEVKDVLAKAQLPVKATEVEDNSLLVRFKDADVQLKAQESLKSHFGDKATVALNLASFTPEFLQDLGAKPMHLGLDLRGGVHFLMEIDMDATIARREEGALSDIRTVLKNNQLRYTSVGQTENKGLILGFADAKTRDDALAALKKRESEMDFTPRDNAGRFDIIARLGQSSIQDIRNYTVEQTMTTLRNRVNELGVSEAVVQRQGLNRVVVELPGIQDTARAKEIWGKTAPLEFHMGDEEHDAQHLDGGRVPGNLKQAFTKDGHPVLLKKRVILTGDSITGATTGYDRDGRPAVNIRLGGSGIGLFKKTTRDNIGHPMAVLYIETHTDTKMEKGEAVHDTKTSEHVISIATIQSALGDNFQITGLEMQEAQNLALFLRAGALPAAVSIIEERTIGPSLGRENIDKGIFSMEVGMAVVVIFMAIYYSLFGVIADIGLLVNLVLLGALLSMIGATLTLPGIAGIVLTIGMAVDANVLIFERIREELRMGTSPQVSIHRGYEKAFSTILDSNVTTLIVAVILFSVGTGPVRGFAVTLSLGIISSMFTAITVTRAFVNLIYGGHPQRKVRVGI